VGAEAMARKDAEGAAEPAGDERPFDHPIRTTGGVDLAAEPPDTRGTTGDRELAEELALGTKPLTTPKLRLQAVHAGAGAAGLLALLNVIGAAEAWSRPVQSLIGPDPGVHAAAQLAAAAVLGGLAVVIYLGVALWACELVLAWSLLELDPWLMHWLYGHGWRGSRTIQLVVAIVLLAAVGVRGAWAIRAARRKDAAGALDPILAPTRPQAPERSPTVQ